VSNLRDLGDRYTEWIDSHEVGWELTMAALATLFVVVGLVDPPPGQDMIYDSADAMLTLIFVAEFASRFLAARKKTWYLRRHWIDALALIPTARGLRLLRLLRLLRMVRAFAGVFRALASLERFAKHRGLLVLFGAWLTTAAICGIALYLAESGINPEVSTFGDALWWAVVTVATVGYGDVTPITSEGRFAASVLIVVGITLWAAVTGTITSLLVESHSGSASIPEQIRQLAELRDSELLSPAEFEEKKAELLARM
jgi:voltage-gated potassium channel